MSRRLSTAMAASVVLLAFLWAGSTTAEDDAARTHALDAVVRLNAGGEIGSGLIVRRVGDILVVVTAYHVVDGAESISAELRSHRGLSIPAEVVERLVDTQADIAVLRLVLPQALTASVSPPRLDIAAIAGARSSRVRLVGQPSFETWFVSPAVEIQKAESHFLRLHYRCPDGMSGGGVFDASWRLVGLTQERLTAQICQALPATRLLEVLDRWSLETDWRISSRSSTGAENTTRVDVVVQALEWSVPTNSMGSPAKADLHPARLAGLLHENPALHVVEGPSPSASLTLHVTALEFRHEPRETNAYGASFRTDVFPARFLVEIRRGDDAVFRKEYALEAVDFDGARGLARRGVPPVSELLEELRKALEPDLEDFVALLE